MALRGKAALAMWWDMAADKRTEYEHWHAHKHFPERLGIPGFLRAARWTDADGGEGVFVPYELEDYSVLSSAPYLARLNAPTPWSIALMPHHRGMVRAQAHVEASRGAVMAQYAATLRFSVGAGNAKTLVAALLPLLEAAKQEAGVVGAHVLRHETPQVGLTTEQKVRGVPDTPGDWVLVICGYDRNALEHRVRQLAASDRFADWATCDGGWRTYALSYSAIPSDLV